MFILFTFLLAFAGLAVAIFFILTQYRTLDLIPPENRKMSPGQVWLQLIPLFGLVWQFFVIARLSDSLKNRISSGGGDATITPDPGNRPTYMMGMAYAILFCCSIIPIPFVRTLFSLAGLVAWVVYWVQLAGFKRQLAQQGKIVMG